MGLEVGGRGGRMIEESGQEKDGSKFFFFS